MANLILKKEESLQKAYPYSLRFRARTYERLTYHSNRLKRKKNSLVDEALNTLLDEEDKKEREVNELKKLLKAGDESGNPIPMPSVNDIIRVAKLKYGH